MAEVGYDWLELGPFGYLPADPARLADELGRRGLSVAGGTVHGFSGLHRPADWPDIERITRQVARLTAAVGGQHVIFVPVPGYRDDKTGAYLEPAELDPGSGGPWSGPATSWEGSWPRSTACGWSSTRTRTATWRPRPRPSGSWTRPIRATCRSAWTPATWPTGTRTTWPSSNRHPDRIGYVHIKQMDPAIVAQADREGLAFGQAVAMGASCEPPSGEPVVEDVAKALLELDRDLFVVVEQDMYPTDFDKPKPIAKRTHDYLRSVGIGEDQP